MQIIGFLYSGISNEFRSRSPALASGVGFYVLTLSSENLEHNTGTLTTVIEKLQGEYGV